jgi:hypothetical protein
MPKFFVRPSLTLTRRKFQGLRGFTGRPFHPPPTDLLPDEESHVT